VKSERPLQSFTVPLQDMVPQGKYLLVAKAHKFTDLLFIEMVRGTESLNIEIEVFLYFLGKFIHQEEVILSSCGGGMPEIILFPENHPLPQEFNFLGPVLPGYFFRAWIRKHSTS
jgi:hypothetical protein